MSHGNLLFGLLCIIVLLTSCSKSVIQRSDDSKTTLEMSDKSPNILVILVDDLGWADVSQLNPMSAYSTPNIDLLAEQSLLFTNGYAASPVCSPTRAALITGKHPTTLKTTDFFRNKDKPFRYRAGKFNPAAFEELLPHDVPTIAEVLKTKGYQTAFIGKWHLGQTSENWPEYYGFDVNIAGVAAGSPPGGYFAPYNNPRLPNGSSGEYLTDRLTNELIAQLTAYANTEQPFFSLMSYYSVHKPLQAPSDTIERYIEQFKDVDPSTEYVEIEQIWPTTDKRYNRAIQANAAYAAMIEHLDKNIGLIVNALKTLNLRDNTIIIFHSDNGGLSTAEGSPTSNLPLRGGKGWLYEGGIRVPFFISVPDSASVGKRSNVPVTTVDIAATIYDIVGINANNTMSLDGSSLLPLIEDDGDHDALNSRSVFFHYPHYSNQGGFPGAAIREGDWKLIERFEDGKVQLFNLANDIGETSNLSTINTKRTADLRAKLNNWYEQKNAAFLLPNPKQPQSGPPWRPAKLKDEKQTNLH